MWYDPLLVQYDSHAAYLRKQYAAPIGPLKPENMPGYRVPKTHKAQSAYAGILDERDTSVPITKTDAKPSAEGDEQEAALASTHSALLAIITDQHASGHEALSIVPQVTETFAVTPTTPHMPTLNLNNGSLPAVAHRSSHFSWIAYGFSNGHFFSTIQESMTPFDMIAAADPDRSGRAMLHEFGKCPNIFSSGHQLLEFVTTATAFRVCGYLIHSPRDMTHESHVSFLEVANYHRFGMP